MGSEIQRGPDIKKSMSRVVNFVSGEEMIIYRNYMSDLPLLFSHPIQKRVCFLNEFYEQCMSDCMNVCINFSWY